MAYNIVSVARGDINLCCCSILGKNQDNKCRIKQEGEVDAKPNK